MLTLRFLRLDDVSKAVKLHREVLGEGIAAYLGDCFLISLYRRITKKKLGFCLIAEENAKVIGLCVGLEPGAIWKFGWEELKGCNLGFIKNIISSLTRSPSILVQYIKGRKHRPKCIELYFLAIANKDQGKGIGTRLIDAFERQLEKRKESEYFLITWSGSRAEKFYNRMGLSKFNETSYLGKQISMLSKKI